MISEGSCDNWSNGCWKFSVAIIEINYYIFEKILNISKAVVLNCNNISQYYCFYFIK